MSWYCQYCNHKYKTNLHEVKKTIWEMENKILSKGNETISESIHNDILFRNHIYLNTNKGLSELYLDTVNLYANNSKNWKILFKSAEKVRFAIKCLNNIPFSKQIDVNIPD